MYIILLFLSSLFVETFQESYGNSGRPILGAPKKKRVDMGPPIIEENEVQILIDEDWDENMINCEIYFVLFYTEGSLITLNVNIYKLSNFIEVLNRSLLKGMNIRAVLYLLESIIQYQQKSVTTG